MGKAGRPPKICKHGLKKWDCKTCVNAWKKDYYENHLSKGKLKSGEFHKKYKKDTNFPNYDLSDKARKFVEDNYWSGSFITRYFLENCVCEQRRGNVLDYCQRKNTRPIASQLAYDGTGNLMSKAIKVTFK